MEAAGSCNHVCMVWRGVPVCVLSSHQSQHANTQSTSKHGGAQLLSAEDLYTKLGCVYGYLPSAVAQTQSLSVPQVPSLF